MAFLLSHAHRPHSSADDGSEAEAGPGLADADVEAMCCVTVLLCAASALCTSVVCTYSMGIIGTYRYYRYMQISIPTANIYSILIAMLREGHC